MIITDTSRFQFHKGTIKTAALNETQGALNNFNSIKVRLKHNYASAFRAVAEFQFHKGTIKTHLDLRQIGHEPQFQFHKGTIKTELANWQ